MEQTTMSTQSIDNTDALNFRYGGGFTITTIGCLSIIAILYGYNDLTSSTTEWHLFSTRLPIIIPNQVMVGIWWILFLGAAYATLLSVLPSVKVILSGREITAQSLLTRKFTTIRYADSMDLVIADKYISITDRNNNKIYLPKLMLSKGAFRSIADRLKQVAPHAM